MKTWQLVLVQLWVLCFAPVWGFILMFAPLVLAPPNPSWVAFVLLVSPPILAVMGSILLWVAKWKDNLSLQKTMSIVLIFFPVLSVIPLFIWN